MDDLVPGARGAQKPRVFLWEAAAAAVRVVGTPADPLFVAKDVCAVLDISKYRDAVARVPDWAKGCPVRVDALGGAQEMATLRESGLYWLILRSDKPLAEPFQRWVCEEVLPQIRKTGAYAVPAAPREPIGFAPHIIEIHHQALPPPAVPTEQDLVCDLLAEVLGLGRDEMVVHGSTLFDVAVREGTLVDWIGSHRLEWQRRGRFLHRLRAYCGRWLRWGDGFRYFSVSAHGRGRARRYHVAARVEMPPQPLAVKTPAPEAVAIVARALGRGAEVIVK